VGGRRRKREKERKECPLIALLRFRYSIVVQEQRKEKRPQPPPLCFAERKARTSLFSGPASHHDPTERKKREKPTFSNSVTGLAPILASLAMQCPCYEYCVSRERRRVGKMERVRRKGRKTVCSTVGHPSVVFIARSSRGWQPRREGGGKKRTWSHSALSPSISPSKYRARREKLFFFDGSSWKERGGGGKYYSTRITPAGPHRKSEKKEEGEEKKMHSLLKFLLVPRASKC